MNHSCKMLFPVLIAILALVSLPTPSASKEDNTTLPLTIQARVISTSQQAVCPSEELRKTVRDEAAEDIQNSIHKTIIPTFCGGPTQDSPAASCSVLSTNCSSAWLLLG